MPPFCTHGTHMPSSGSFVTMYLAELHFENGYMEIDLLISILHGWLNEEDHGSIDRSGNSRGGGCSLIVISSSFECDRLGSAAIE